MPETIKGITLHLELRPILRGWKCVRLVGDLASPFASPVFSLTFGDGAVGYLESPDQRHTVAEAIRQCADIVENAQS